MGFGGVTSEQGGDGDRGVTGGLVEPPHQTPASKPCQVVSEEAGRLLSITEGKGPSITWATGHP